jgi:hypothetical protein
MRKEVPRRNWSAMTGIGFVVLTVIAIALGGEPPKADDSAVDIARYLADKPDALLLSSAAWFIAAIFLLWFLGGLRAHLSVDEDSDGLAATSYGEGSSARFSSPRRSAGSTRERFKLRGPA